MKIVLFIVWFTHSLLAHNLQHDISYEESAVVTLHFADEGDFAYERYEIYAPKNKIPFQVGRTDAHGRVLFLPDIQGIWEIKLFSEDGHGKIIELEVDQEKKVETRNQNMDLYRSLGGLLLLLSVFLVIYFTKRKKK